MLGVALYTYRSSQFHLRRLRARMINRRDRWRDPAASSFFNAMRDGGYDAGTYLDVLPKHRLIYLSVPKSASTTIRMFLSALEMGAPPPPEFQYKRRLTGLKTPTQLGISAFYRLANDANTLRFSFVRNPYARLLSAWADKFQDKPLIPGDPSINTYLAHRASIARSLPEGAGHTLSFAQFVEFAIATADQRVDIHWQSQDDFVTVPGITLDLIGRVETFRDDFSRVLDHVGATDKLRRNVFMPLNMSQHKPWQRYYNDLTAERVYRAYERDFDRFGYARSIPDAG